MKSAGEDKIRDAIANAEEAAGDDKGSGIGKRDLQLAKKLLNDSGNGERFRGRHGRNLMFVPKIGRYAWTGSHWSNREGEKHWNLSAQKTATRMMWDEAGALSEELAAGDGDDKADNKRLKEFRDWAVESGNRSRLNAMQSVSEPHLEFQVDELDRDPFLFNVQNGTLELGTKKDRVAVRLRKHNRLDRMTRIAPVGYDPDAQCNLFRGFLQSVLPDTEVQGFVQRWFGHCATGDYSEEKLVCFWGQGRNGKGVLTKLFRWLFGDYAAPIEFASLLSDDRRRGSEATPDLADLTGVRAVFAGEPKKNVRLDDGRVKQITGGDDLKVRHLNRDFFELKPTFKLTLSFNNKPRITDDTHGMWSRVHLVPFTVIIPDDQQDHELLNKLKAEGPGVLNWALDGFRQWRESGLQAPQAVVAATAEYRSESDQIGQFLAAATKPEAGGSIRSAELYACYQGWCAAMDQRAVSQTKFGRDLTTRGHTGWQDERGRIVRGGLAWSGQCDWEWEAPL